MNEQQKPKERVLKVEEVGDFWSKKTMPRIRLKGKWLARVGMLPNNYVLVESPKLGVLILQLMEKID